MKSNARKKEKEPHKKNNWGKSDGKNSLSRMCKGKFNGQLIKVFEQFTSGETEMLYGIFSLINKSKLR